MGEKVSSDTIKNGSPNESLNELQTDPVEGLTAIEAKRRMDKYGRNEVEEKQPNLLVGFLKRFWGLTAWMLEVAIVLSFVLGKY